MLCGYFHFRHPARRPTVAFAVAPVLVGHIALAREIRRDAVQPPAVAVGVTRRIRPLGLRRHLAPRIVRIIGLHAVLRSNSVNRIYI